MWVTYINGTCTGTFFGSPPPGALGRGQNLIFWAWSCGISNLRGWAVDQERMKIFNLWSNLWPWDGVKGSITIRFLRERGDLRWRAIECVLVRIRNGLLQLIRIGKSVRHNLDHSYGLYHIHIDTISTALSILYQEGLLDKISVKLCISSRKTVFTTPNSAYLDEVPPHVAFYLGLHCLQKHPLLVFRKKVKWVKV